MGRGCKIGGFGEYEVEEGEYEEVDGIGVVVGGEVEDFE